MSSWIVRGLLIAVLVVALAAGFLFWKNGSLNRLIGSLTAASQVATDANKDKSDAVKERARIDRRVRDLPDPSLLDKLR